MSSNQLKYESLNSDRLFKVITRHTATEILTAELNSSSKNIFAVSILRQVCKVDKQTKNIDHPGKTFKDFIGKRDVFGKQRPK